MSREIKRTEVMEVTGKEMWEVLHRNFHSIRQHRAPELYELTIDEDASSVTIYARYNTQEIPLI